MDETHNHAEDTRVYDITILVTKQSNMVRRNPKLLSKTLSWMQAKSHPTQPAYYKAVLCQDLPDIQTPQTKLPVFAPTALPILPTLT